MQNESPKTESDKTESPETESPETSEPTETETKDEAMLQCHDDVQARRPSLHRAIAQRKPPSTPPYTSQGITYPSLMAG